MNIENQIKEINRIDKDIAELKELNELLREDLVKCGKCGRLVPEEDTIREGNGTDDIQDTCLECVEKRRER